MSFASLACTVCGRTYPARLDGVCACGGLLLARYSPKPSSLPRLGLWSWRDFLPECEPVSLGESETPLIDLGGALFKDDGRCATGSFKARGAAVGVAMARSLGATRVVLATAGNAGAAWASYCAAAKIPCSIWAASDAPASAVAQARAYGADVTVVGGSISDAGAAAGSFARDAGAHFAATFREPWRVEGKKTALFEVAAALGGRLPDAAVLPVGGGVGAVAWHKAASELRAAGAASGATRIYAVQAEGCAPIVKAFEAGAEQTESWAAPRTAAPGIRIRSPLAGGLVLRALRQSGGGAVAVSDDAMAAARDALARAHGLSVCLESAAAWAGYERLREAGAFGAAETVVVYGTGSGLIDG